LAIIINKLYKRATYFSLSVLSNYSTLLLNVWLSWIICDYYDFLLWGEYIYYNLIVNTVLFFVSWGNKDFLLKRFSNEPAQIASLWAKDVGSRTLLLFLLTPLIFFMKGGIWSQFLLCSWILSLYASKSFDALFNFEKRFKEMITIDVLSYSTLILLILLKTINLSINHLLMWQIATQAVKATVGCYLFYYLLSFKNFRIDVSYLKTSFSFFLPIFVGFLQGKADSYVVMALLPRSELGKYQILLNLLSLIHGAYASGLAPFTKYIYRLSKLSVRKLSFISSLVGCLIAVPYIFFVRFVISKIYHLEFSITIYTIACLQIIPFLLYFTKNLVLYKYNMQSQVAWICFITAAFNILICLFCIPSYGLMGALVANTIAQWLTFLLFKYSEERLILNNKIAAC